MQTEINHAQIIRSQKKRMTKKALKRYWPLYLLILPAFVYVFLLNYLPMAGVQIAFKDYNARLGIWGSKFVGLKHFETFVKNPMFGQMIANTLVLNLYSLAASFPATILFALMLNTVRVGWFKKAVQVISYVPHFISTVAMCGLIFIFMGNSNSVFNQFRSLLGLAPAAYLTKAELFPSIYVWTGVWQGIGYGSIIYLATLNSVDQNIVEAAKVDGVNLIQRIWHIDLPCLLPTIIVQLIMRTGSILEVGFEKVLLLQNSLNISTSQVISTYVYNNGLLGGRFSYTTAIGLFNTVIGFVLLVIVNLIVNKLSRENGL